MIVASIQCKNKNQAIQDIENSSGADLIELRFDYLKNYNEKVAKEIIKKCKKSVIFTFRSKKEGGFRRVNEKRRLDILKGAVNLPVKYIDIEFSSNKNVIKNLVNSKKKIIVSFHDFKKTPKNLSNVYLKIRKLKPDQIKIVTQANSILDNFKVFGLLKNARKDKVNLTSFCMGSYGNFSRVFGMTLGKFMYTSIGSNKTAPGQISLKEAVEKYNVLKLKSNTKIIGLIGNPVEHSWSHVIHNTGFKIRNFKALFVKYQVDKIKEFMTKIRRYNVVGFSVTIPHKIAVMKFLDKIDDTAKKIGAVNTIYLSKGKLVGTNTDWYGVVKALKNKTNLRKKTALVLGAGGASRAVVFGLKKEGANVVIYNRTLSKAKSLASEFGCQYTKSLKEIKYDLLVNTTSVGMYPDISKSPIPAKFVREKTVVFDAVFNPIETKLLKIAKKKHCKTISGIEWLIYCTKKQFEIWTGKGFPEKMIRRKLKAVI